MKNYHPYKGTPCREKWSKEETFSLENVFKLPMKGDRFVVLNFTDIQIVSIEPSKHKPTFAMLDDLIKRAKPDLITLTGDQVAGGYKRRALKKLCRYLDKTGIPWAPVLGNHDGQGNITSNGVGDIYLRYKNVLFRKNDPTLGVGNYTVVIEKDNKPLHALIMMDSHAKTVYPEGTDYDFIWQKQIDWYAWTIKGLRTYNPNIPTTCCFHIPLPQFLDAWEGYQKGLYQGGNEKRERVGCAKADSGGYDSGLFAKIKELRSTDLVLVGHNHTNNYYVDYDGITLAFSMKTGYGSYFDPDMLGATVTTYSKEGFSLQYLFYP